MGKIKVQHTQTANFYYDEVMALLTDAEWKVFSYAVRRTFGFQEDQARISTRQFSTGLPGKDRGSGKSLATVVSCLESLERFGLVRREAGHGAQATLWIVEQEEDLIDLAGLIQRKEAELAADQARTAKARQARAQTVLSDKTVKKGGAKKATVLSDKTATVLSDKTVNPGHLIKGKKEEIKNTCSPPGSAADAAAASVSLPLKPFTPPPPLPVKPDPAPAPASEQLEQPQKPQKSPEEVAAEKVLTAQKKALLARLEALWGYSTDGMPKAQKINENAGIKALASYGITPDQLEAFYRFQLQDKFYLGKHLGALAISKNIRPWLQNHPHDWQHSLQLPLPTETTHGPHPQKSPAPAGQSGAAAAAGPGPTSGPGAGGPGGAGGEFKAALEQQQLLDSIFGGPSPAAASGG